MQKNIYILKLLLEIVTTGTEALVSRNKFLYACACEIGHVNVGTLVVR
jgi:hypothetical protein